MAGTEPHTRQDRAFVAVENSISVMAGLVPAIHVAPLAANLGVSGGSATWDDRDKALS